MMTRKTHPVISPTDHSVQADASYVRVEGPVGGVFSCEVQDSSSPVWGLGAAGGEPPLYTPAGVSVPVPAAALHTAAHPAGHSETREDCSLLEKRGNTVKNDRNDMHVLHGPIQRTKIAF